MNFYLGIRRESLREMAAEMTDTIFAFPFHLLLMLRFRVLHLPLMELLRAAISHSVYTQEFLTLKAIVISEEQRAVPL